jgi:hypothetical protein
MSQGLKPRDVDVLDVRAEARTYLRGKGEGRAGARARRRGACARDRFLVSLGMASKKGRGLSTLVEMTEIGLWRSSFFRDARKDGGK